MWDIVTIFMENKSGKLAKVTDVLAKNNINILLMDIADNGQFGLLRLLTPCPKKTRDVLYDENFTVALEKVVLVEINDQVGGLANLTKVLDKDGINISEAYGCILDQGKRALFVIQTKDPERLETLLKTHDIKLVDSL